jgi:SynChlorMet cassette radical SAM/SPASM protein ScmF
MQHSTAEKEGGTLQRHPLSILYLYLTAGCNLQCRHCYMAPGLESCEQHYPALAPHLLEHIVRQGKYVGLKLLKLSGGEPLLHPRIGQILEVIRREEVPLAVATNGTLCTPALTRELARSNPLYVTVSIDGADPETHDWMRGTDGAFASATRGIRNLVTAGIPTYIMMSVVRQNAGQMEAVVRLAESLGALAVKFIFVRPMAHGEKMQRAGEMPSVRDVLKLGYWVENDLATRTKIPVAYTLPMAFRSLGKMYGNGYASYGNCGILRILGVLASGYYAMCGIGATIPELVFGHAERDALAEVWHENPVLMELREGMPSRFKGICSRCAMKGVCQGHCLAMNYYRTRDFWAPHWFCEEAEKEGLFPDSRRMPRLAAPSRVDRTNTEARA